MESNHYQDQKINGRITLKQMLEKYDVETYTGSAQGNDKLSDSIRKGNFLDGYSGSQPVSTYLV